ncbi:uncharacterized protein LOC108633130 [Ceratina calcarata]|uniref:Uncharacterized protein LOC108633130 n=1 Tax=Ceratina calcarata TaxID=156304 RepID=A0AAJ7RW67_9HYME|nr:uncharacterized protein LOC108633130 [Ceratina calcarata]
MVFAQLRTDYPNSIANTSNVDIADRRNCYPMFREELRRRGVQRLHKYCNRGDKITAAFIQVSTKDKCQSFVEILTDSKMSVYRWTTRRAGQGVPSNAVHGGRDIQGSTIYVGRAYHEGDMLPAKVIPDNNVAYVCHAGQEHAKYEFEVLCQPEFAWEYCHGGAIPGDAVVGGQTSDGERLYIGRVLHNGAQTVGKVQPSHGCLYIPFDGQELSFRDYEVLVMH